MVVEYIGEQWVKYKINRCGSTTLGPAPLPAGAGGGGVGRPLLALWPMCSVGRRSPVHAHGTLGWGRGGSFAHGGAHPPSPSTACGLCIQREAAKGSYRRWVGCPLQGEQRHGLLGRLRRGGWALEEEEFLFCSRPTTTRLPVLFDELSGILVACADLILP